MTQAYRQHQSAAAAIVARCAVVTLSDTRTADSDTSGRRIQDLLTAAGHTAASYTIIPDDPARLDAALTDLASRPDVDVILTNGGTGISRRDQTVPTIERRLTTVLPGFGELFRMLSFQEIGSGALASRALGGLAGRQLLFAMPGSTAAVELAMTRLILPELKHLLGQMRKP
jgi:molybdopterin adenylyltransferase